MTRIRKQIVTYLWDYAVKNHYLIKKIVHDGDQYLIVIDDWQTVTYRDHFCVEDDIMREAGLSVDIINESFLKQYYKNIKSYVKKKCAKNDGKAL